MIAVVAIAAGVHADTADGMDDAAFREMIREFSGSGDRSTGSPGAGHTAAYIRRLFTELGYEQVGAQSYPVTLLRHTRSQLILPTSPDPVDIPPMLVNAVSPGTIAPGGITGPLVYAGRGELADLNGKAVSGAIIVMDMAAGKNWVNVAALGAKALIYVDRKTTNKFFYQEKLELSPVDFPRFWMTSDHAGRVFGDFESAPDGLIYGSVRITSDAGWETIEAENIYCLVPGTDPEKAEELVIVEAFYDSSVWVQGRSPGADEALGIANLLDLAEQFKLRPPARSILLLATSGHDQNLAGMRDAVWSFAVRSRNLRADKRRLQSVVNQSKNHLKILESHADPKGWIDLSDTGSTALKAALSDEIKNEVNRISQALIQLRLDRTVDMAAIKRLTDRRLILRRLDWQDRLGDLPPDAMALLAGLLPDARQTYTVVLEDARRQLEQLASTNQFRSLIKSKDLVAAVSLHLSSHGDGVGAFNRGWMYPLKSIINRVNAYTTIDKVFQEGADHVQRDQALPQLYKDTLRPSRKRTWQSYLPDKPALGGELTSVAGVVGVTMATTSDARYLWGTPYDVPENIDWDFAHKQRRLVNGMISHVAGAEKLTADEMPRFGFGDVTGRAKFLRHGELFPDQPAPGSIILTYQGLRRYYTRVDSMGRFRVKGIADKKHVIHKAIIEGYRFDPHTGEVVWAIDKEQTGKNAYRVKMERFNMETDLVMFACRQSTLFNLLEPRSLRYMTKMQLYDGRLEAPPMRYWYSRIDTWSSVISSIYLEPGSRLKLTLSDDIIEKKLILTHADAGHPAGTGYPVDTWPKIAPTEYYAARDMWALLSPRIDNLEKRGIYSERIHDLTEQGRTGLSRAAAALENRQYEQFYESARQSWALASRVYDHVEKVQKDVLFGVLFYIALFVPFAFCMERFLFSFRNIYKRIAAFFIILFILIAVIYAVHPAFQLAYSPMVVILAFFIMGLSVMVSMIIFFRFEEEMILLQRRAKQMRAEEVSMWKAFISAFFLGVSNLRRRRIRTILTCSTLVILTFTIMSFTSVKTLRHHARVKFQDRTPYQGILLKNMGLQAWQDMAPEAYGVLTTSFVGKGTAAPRVWLETEDKIRRVRVSVMNNGSGFDAQGIVGLSAREPQVSGLDRVLTAGRWFAEGELDTVILPERAAQALGLDPDRLKAARVTIWGIPFRVAGLFSARRLQELTDLDGEIITPVTFSSESVTTLTEVEMEAMESGEDLRALQSKYEHVPAELTVFVPSETLLAAGGRVKSMAVKVRGDVPVSETARSLADRFGLALFSGEPDGTFVYNVADTLSYSGIPNIIIPLVIAILIVLNTMIGSVYERKREIGIYTSVGLAPSHVSFLFVAEALAFAVISVVLGYILAQSAAKLFSDTSMWAGLTVNYSSLAGVGAMVLVILVVLLSVIYPSKVAARIAIPDVKKSWTLPEAKDNRIEVALPFLMKSGEEKSAGGFIFDYFDGHQDVSHGLFSTGDLSLQREAVTAVGRKEGSPDDPSVCEVENCILINTRVWLAPFDLGIVQRVSLFICHAADEPGFMEIQTELNRESGEANAWHRINKVFIHHLRKQLLVWRSLDPKEKERYAKLVT
ncbi:MAG: peptide ABC transporter permease [Desulfobacteraceae bacterium]|nr:peptide ABC transporter permease [Desulfobacteraceae bacterium]